MKKKKGLVILICAAAVLAAGIGVFFAVKNSAEPVNVYPFHYLGMTEYWGDSRESYGPVTTDKIQTVFLSDTQTVTEILVQPGAEVKKGDILMTFDTTLDDLALERKRLDVEKLKLQQQSAREQLAEIQNMVPMTVPDSTDTELTPENLGTALKESSKIYAGNQYNGTAPENAMICWLRDDAVITDQLLETLRRKSLEYRESRTVSAASAEVVEEEILEEVPEEVVEEEIWEEEFPEEPDVPDVPEETDPPEEPDLPSEEPDLPEDPEEPPEEPDLPEEDMPEPPGISDNPQSAYVVFKVTAGNMSLGAREVWQGVQIFGDSDSGFAMKFFNADMLQDHSVVLPEAPDAPEIEPDSGYTADQIAEMRSRQEKLIRDLAIKIDMAEAEYKIMQTEMNDGHVYAKIDGEVVSVLTEEEARDTRHPIVKISGGGGFYIEGSISELEMDGLTLGQEVTVNDWNTGMTYTGKVVELRDFPGSRDNWNGTGNPNVSYYPFRVFVDGDADLQEGSHASVMYSTATAENGIYLENAFLRAEQGQHYVWLRGAGGKLEKRFVTVGKSLWGSYTEILSGITEEDCLAFPYGKELKDGAPTVEADISELYAY